VETSILNGTIFEEPDTTANDKETWTWDDDIELSGPDDDGPIDDGDDEAEVQQPVKDKKPGHFFPPPSIAEAERAFHDLANILKPRRKKGYGFKDPDLDRIVMERLSGMKLFCYNYIQMQDEKVASPGSSQWGAASLHTANSLGGNVYMARSLREWTRAFIADPEFIPEHHQKGRAGRSLIDDENFTQELHLHLQSIGKYCTTEDIIRYVARPEILAKLNRKATISHATAHRWMKKMNYRWTAEPHGQYADGHERPDVIDYRQNIFLPAIQELQEKTRKWGSDGTEDEQSDSDEPRTVLWFHDKSSFYAHDRQKKRWVHKSEKAKPYAKGEGHSLMIADFVSADYGWLRSPDGKESARVIFRAGKGRDGYFDNENIRTQAAHAMEILKKHYPHERHILIFDNTTTHLKRAGGSLSVSRMPKGPSANLFVEVNMTDDTGKGIYGPDGKILKQKIPMANSKFKDGTEQPFYYPEDHELAGQFKGMAKILEE
jgi:hypothetical protein